MLSLVSSIMLLLTALISMTACSQAFTAVATSQNVSSGSSMGLPSASAANGAASSKVWLASFLAILVISLVGLAGVAVVPLVKSSYYNHFIQYLVALAVGSLTGDAMLHLLPHAIVKSAMESAHSQRWHSERQTVLKGLAALAGVYCFFLAEKLVVLITDYRAERQAMMKQLQAERPSSAPSDGLASPDRQQRRVSRMYGEKSCDEIITTGLSSKAMRSIDNFRALVELNEVVTSDSHIQRASREAAAVAVAPAQIGEEEAAETEEAVDETGKDDGNKHDADDAVQRLPTDTPCSVTTECQVHGHGQGHGHASGSLASAAWMVILGDGLHNFADGLAVGSAFAQGLAGGASTSLAVLCHELPHELGDFAVLLKTGMSVRRALFYNLLSSALAAVGMVIGVSAGNVTSASYWIFAITGGIFIYVSLVDMLPELNLLNLRPGESRMAHFALQTAGIATGLSVMCCMALFEYEIKSALGDNGS